jgi:hypothetical protein
MAAGPYHLFVKNIRRIWSDQPQKADYDLTATGKEAKS